MCVAGDTGRPIRYMPGGRYRAHARGLLELTVFNNG